MSEERPPDFSALLYEFLKNQVAKPKEAENEQPKVKRPYIRRDLVKHSQQRDLNQLSILLTRTLKYKDKIDAIKAQHEEALASSTFEEHPKVRERLAKVKEFLQVKERLKREVVAPQDSTPILPTADAVSNPMDTRPDEVPLKPAYEALPLKVRPLKRRTSDESKEVEKVEERIAPQTIQAKEMTRVVNEPGETRQVMPPIQQKPVQTLAAAKTTQGSVARYLDLLA